MPPSVSEADDIWEEWDGTDHLGREINAIGRDEDRPPSEPEEWDVAASAEETEAANEAEDTQLLVVQGEGGQVVTTVGDVVGQLQGMRISVGDAGALDLSGHLSLDHQVVGPGSEDDMDFDSDIPQLPHGSEDDMDFDSDIPTAGETSDGEGAGQAPDIVPDVSGHPTLVPYTAEVPCFPTLQAHQFSRVPLQNPPKDLGFDLKDYEPVKILISCDFCTTALCAVCSGGSEEWKTNWEYVRCGGCGGMMCPECCHQSCSVCQRGLCQKCDERERIQLSPKALETLFPYVPNLYETVDGGTEIYSCLRCLLRRGVGLTKAAAKAANPNGPPVDGYGREVDTNGLVDPRPGLQIVREQLRREFDPSNRGTLVGVMEGMPHAVHDLLERP